MCHLFTSTAILELTQAPIEPIHTRKISNMVICAQRFFRFGAVAGAEPGSSRGLFCRAAVLAAAVRLEFAFFLFFLVLRPALAAFRTWSYLLCWRAAFLRGPLADASGGDSGRWR